jgi:hypothetical protein
MFRNDFTLTKRQLGLLLLVIGGVAFVVLLSLDYIGGGREGGIGPAQRLALLTVLLVMGVGLTLIPIRDTPA